MYDSKTMLGQCENTNWKGVKQGAAPFLIAVHGSIRGSLSLKIWNGKKQEVKWLDNTLIVTGLRYCFHMRINKETTADDLANSQKTKKYLFRWK